MQKMPLIINGVNFSAMTARLGYTIRYEDRMGGNSMTMANGDYYPDVLTRRPVLVWPLNALTGAELAQLHAAINAAVQVPVTYQDTETNATKTAYFHGTIGDQEVGVIRNGGYYRYRGTTLTMKAR